MKYAIIACLALALGACGEVSRLGASIDAAVCSDSREVRAARLALLDQLDGPPVGSVVARDCDGDGLPDDLSAPVKQPTEQ